eukprot:Blabericola_migrator_1__7459@NODE_3807_length_1495_cov_29_762605_g1281_i1_p1_GENE_NODE_3807_length_1495_cov_29_762605_g1281_i1NODE_3807_length_1495_cov_29_762605_g1281_i1_p1_ORF_typecomplete_len262_score25_27NIF/PF03031_18/3_3e17HAD_2/PF13419_6/4_5e05NT5C/PF06941_12/0_034HAD/PF12710_7/0_47DUF705/PF05152_12/0_13_NODE_3807_length_1495_cov_29_762605_g1281_i1163948
MTSFQLPKKNYLPSSRPTVVRLGHTTLNSLTENKKRMVAYHPAICGPDGRFDHEAFRSAFLRSLQQFQLNPTSFFLPVGSAPLVLPSQDRGLYNDAPSRQYAPPYTATADEDALEELSDIEDDEGGSTSSAASSTSSHFATSSTTKLRALPSGATFPQPRVKIVFDLDNTLLHAQSKYKLNGAELNLDDFRDSMGRPEMFRFTLPRQKNQAYFIKFRPGVREFISEVSKYCDLAIHTNATREYADVVMSIIDPDRSLFGAR